MGMELNEPYGDPTEGGSKGGGKDPIIDPTEPPTLDPSGASDMTTEDPTEGGSGDPYLQEQEEEQEKEEKNISTNTGRKSHKIPHKEKDIKDIMEHQNCDWNTAIGILDDFETYFSKKNN
jgi:hypothetical protein